MALYGQLGQFFIARYSCFMRRSSKSLKLLKLPLLTFVQSRGHGDAVNKLNAGDVQAVEDGPFIYQSTRE